MRAVPPILFDHRQAILRFSVVALTLLIYPGSGRAAAWTGEDEDAYSKRFAENFTSVSPVPTLDDYATVERYDELYLGQPLEAALENLTNDRGRMSWGLSYRMSSLNEMARTTGARRYLEANLKCSLAALAARDDAKELKLWTDELAPVWGAGKYSKRGRAAYAVHTGMIVYPMLDFLLLAREDADFRSNYQAELESIQQSALESLAFHDRQWRDGPGEGEGHYRALNQEEGFDGKILPGNRLSAMGRALWCGYKLTGQAVYRDRALGIATYIKNRLTLAPDGAYYWPYQLPEEPVKEPAPKESVSGEDVSHGSLTMCLPILLAHEGLVFTDEDMQRLGKMVTNGFARQNNGILFASVNGNPGSNPTLVQIPARWLRLTPLAKDVYPRIAEFQLRYQPVPGPLALALLLRYKSCELDSAVEQCTKSASVLFPRSRIEAAKSNAEKYDWARAERDATIARAKPWLESTDDTLWEMMFSPTITRSWMVWSDGYCPISKKPVKMYEWEVDAWKHPWKVQSPHTGDLFPSNDFHAFYSSGLDVHGVFQPELADRALLFNAEHTEENDPLRGFCVDDGEGYVEDEKRWRFIGFYLKVGQWKQLVLGGINALSKAYLVTGDPLYARKAAILLDRVADVYPDFHFRTQGEVYEYRGHRGFVSTWHDACEEVREMAEAYDRIFDAIVTDEELVRFLSAKAETHSLRNPKDTFRRIQANIEDRIFRETLRREDDIRSNYPRTPIAVTTMKAVLGWPGNREEIVDDISSILQSSVKEDGLTGEEGLDGYTTIFPTSFATFVMIFDGLDPTLLEELFKRFPDLRQTYRFHIDTMCLDAYYPHVGDAGLFGQQVREYKGVTWSQPEMDSFLWRMYELSGDPDFAKVIYRERGEKLENIGRWLFAQDPEKLRQGIHGVIERCSKTIELPDVKKEQWGLSILRSGKGDSRRAVWLDHDTDGRHSHHDALNLGLFAKGLDLLPDAGYPPVGYGGWGAPKSRWYSMSASHSTVVVDGESSTRGSGMMTIWAPGGERFGAVRVEAPAANGGKRFERTIAMIDLSEEDAYVFDLFRVEGGRDHAKFVGSFFGRAQTETLTLATAEEYGHKTQTRGFKTDPNPPLGWSVDWAIEDRYGVLPPGKKVSLRYTDLTYGAAASLGEGWISTVLYGGGDEWIPRLMIRRKSDTEPLVSCFAGIFEPYEEQSKIAEIKRWDASESDRDAAGAVTLRLLDGSRHLIGFRDGVSSTGDDANRLIQSELALETDAELCWIAERDGVVERAALCHGTFLRLGEWSLKLKEKQEFLEVVIDDTGVRVVAGDSNAVESIGE